MIQLWVLYSGNPLGHQSDLMNPVVDSGWAEHYQIKLESYMESDGAQAHSVTERHAWWNEQTRCAVNETLVLHLEDIQDENEAKRVIKERLGYRARTGFIHLFRIDPESPQGYNHTILDDNGKDTTPDRLDGQN